MDRHPFWRKNRRPAPRGQGFRSIGVDLNRNFPFLWRFDRHFAQGTVESTHKPGDYETYVGPRPASEPETRNVMWLLDRFPNIRYYVRSEEHTSELQSLRHLVCRLLLEKKKPNYRK